MEGAHKASCAPEPRAKSSDFIGAWARPTCWSWRVSFGGGGSWWLRYQGVLIGMSSPGGATLTLRPGPAQQCWEASGQTTNRAGTKPHPSSDRLRKVFLSLQPPLNTPHDTALPTRGPRPSSTHQWAGTCPSLKEVCTIP